MAPDKPSRAWPEPLHSHYTCFNSHSVWTSWLPAHGFHGAQQQPLPVTAPWTALRWPVVLGELCCFAASCGQVLVHHLTLMLRPFPSPLPLSAPGSSKLRGGPRPRVPFLSPWPVSARSDTSGCGCIWWPLHCHPLTYSEPGHFTAQALSFPSSGSAQGRPSTMPVVAPLCECPSDRVTVPPSPG